MARKPRAEPVELYAAEGQHWSVTVEHVGDAPAYLLVWSAVDEGERARYFVVPEKLSVAEAIALASAISDAIGIARSHNEALRAACEA